MSFSYTRSYGPDNLMRSLYSRNNILQGQLNVIAERGAQEIADLSKAYVPLDSGEAEESHRVVVRSTRIGNPAYDIEVGGIVNGVDVDEYIYMLHEGIMRGKPYDLGDGSLSKAASTGKQVGPKFLERAFTELKPSIVQNYRNALKETFGK